MSLPGIAIPLMERAVGSLFVAAGVPAAEASIVAEELVAADVEGVASHGIMLVPMYLERLARSSVRASGEDRVVSEKDAVVVLDGGNRLGQLTARHAVDLAIAKAGAYGLGAVAVRNAFHIGALGRYTRLMAEAGCIGCVTTNTRPLLPAPGGALALTGNNPLAISVPSEGEYPAEVDMALSAVAMGRIRNAAAAGEKIPKGWATNKYGEATTDPEDAIAGMLLPAAGPKGFGLAFVLDLIAGGLSGGAIGSEVGALYGDLSAPYGCSAFFLAVDVAHFVSPADLKKRSSAALGKASNGPKAPGTRRVYAPGELAYATRQASAGACHPQPAALRSLIEAGRKLGVDLSYLTAQEQDK